MTVPERLSAALADRYRLERELGQGGMATVYLAHDLKHDRPVAIKVLRPELAALIGAERFLSEIKTTANLQHPHILPLFDSGATPPRHSERSEESGRSPARHSDPERSEGEESGRLGAEFLYYVMPYVDGESLRARLLREHQLPVPDALRLAKEVASALDYAHKHGVVHRDVKPENILLHDGRALVADFGIALAASRAGDRMTQSGMSLGTPHYMSPEQAMGEREITPRADIYALGAMTYEMLLGEPPFTGPTVQAILAKVMTEDPAPIAPRRRSVPPAVEAAVLTALQKLPADRFGTAKEFADALEATGVPTSATRSLGRAARPPRLATAITGLAAALLLGVVAIALLRNRGPSPADRARLQFTIAPPQGTRFDAVNWATPGITPDGQAIVFAARGPDGARLYLRRLNDFVARPLAGTEDAVPFVRISPDGQWADFQTSAMELKRVSLSGTAGALSLGASPDWWLANLGLWSGDSLVHVVVPRAIWAVATEGGAKRLVTVPDTAAGEREFANAHALPDSRLLVTILTDSGPRIAVIGQDARRTWVSGLKGFPRAILPPDRVLTFANGRLLLSRLDGSSLQLRDSAQVVSRDFLGGPVAASQSGTMAYFRLQRGAGQRLVWVDRRGASSPTPAEPGAYRIPRLSPDGRRVGVFGSTSSESSVALVIDLVAGGRVKMTALDASGAPVWDRTGRYVLFPAGTAVPQAWMRQPADGSRSAEVAFTTPMRSGVAEHSPDGSVVLDALESTLDIAVAEPDGRTRVLVGGPGSQRSARLSRDGKWLAYMSNESGRFEIYVQPWPALDGKWAVSVEGGTEPVWSWDGTELFFRRGNAMMTSRIVTAPTFQPGRPVELFDAARFAPDAYGYTSYDVAPDGRFLMIEDDPDARIELRVEWNALAPGSEAAP